MIRKPTILAIAFIAACAAYLLCAQNAFTLSVWDGVYTQQQAERGQTLYHDHCEDCHGEHLEGDAEAPPLAGGTFLTNWDGMPLGSLYLRIRRDMPLNYEVGKLSPSENADVLAFILSVSRFPAGRAELPRSVDVLNQIRFDAARPERKR